MVKPHQPVTSYAEALARGFKPLAQMTAEFRARVEAAHEEENRNFAARVSPCGPGHDPQLPCKDNCYSNGVHEVCFCSPTNQCDANCLFSDC